MPPKEIERLEFEFDYVGQIYYFDTYRILKDGNLVCYCDLTGTEYHGNKLLTLLCCQIALDAYYKGKQCGETKHKQEVSNMLKGLIIM